MGKVKKSNQPTHWKSNQAPPTYSTAFLKWTANFVGLGHFQGSSEQTNFTLKPRCFSTVHEKGSTQRPAEK